MAYSYKQMWEASQQIQDRHKGNVPYGTLCEMLSYALQRIDHFKQTTLDAQVELRALKKEDADD